MRRHAAVLAFAFLTVFPIHAAITGLVMNAEGQPVTGARVSMYALESAEQAGLRLQSKAPERQPLAQMQADSKGRFNFDTPKDAVVQVIATAQGFAPVSARAEREDDLGAMALRPAEARSGTIRANGKPVAGAMVVWSGSGEVIARTDEQGRYSVPDPSKWAGQVQIFHPDFAILDEPSMRIPSSAVAVDRTLSPGKPLSGKVVAEDGKTPVGGAVIRLDGTAVATSGEDGAFAIAHAGEKGKVLTARISDRMGSRVLGGTAAPLIKLGRAAVVSGSIRDLKSGAPVGGAEVRLRRTSRFDGSAAAAGFTDAKGTFTITGVAAAQYEINVIHPGYSVQVNSVSVGEGEKVSRTLLATEFGRLAGTVLDEQKRPVVRASIDSRQLTREQGMFFRPTPTGDSRLSAPDGTFLIRVAPDTDVELSATRKGYPAARSATLRVAPGERRKGIVLTIPGGMPVTGRIVDRDGKPLAGVIVDASESSPNAGAFMIQRMGFMGARERDDAIKTANDGTFAVRLKEGKYDFGFRRDGYAPKTARAIQVNAAMKPMEVTLEPGVEIAGRVVRSGQGLAGFNVFVRSEGANAFAETAADGSFRLTDLVPGQVTLSVGKAEEFARQTKTVIAPATDVVIEVPPGGTISGRVVDKSSRQPLTTFEAGISPERGGGGMIMIVPTAMRPFTSDDGSFVLENVPAGSTQLLVNAAGYTTGRVPNLTVEEGKTLTDVTVELDRGVRLVGHVTGPDGTPLAGVTVRPDQMSGRVVRFVGTDPGTTTDANGDFAMEALEPGDRTFLFSRSGYLTTQKSVSLTGNEVRADVQLSTGMGVSGTVVSDAGVPVGDANVYAISAAQMNTGSRSARTDPNGNFTIDGLAPGRYTFNATKSGYASGDLRDFDISAGAPVRITLRSGGVIYGQVSGLAANELQQAVVTASSTNGGGSAAVDATGSYRIEGAPTGTVRVSARMGSGFSGVRSSAVQSVQVDPGSPVKVDISFKSDTVIQGRIIRNGQPVDGAMISFYPKDAQAQTSARTSSNSSGEYQVSGLDDATYNVMVVDLQRSAQFSTTYQVRGSGSFDVDMKSAALRGRVTSSTGDPVSDAVVDLRESSDIGMRFASRSAQTDASGSFTIDSVPPGSYNVSAGKAGYGTKLVPVTVAENGADVSITLSPNAGVTLTIIDARDQRPISAYVHVTDTQGRTVFDTPGFGGGSAEPQKLPLDPGTYRVSVMAYGYAAQTLNITSPSSPTVGLTPGGSIAVQSKGSALRRARLLGADGRESTRGFGGSGIFTVDPSPGVTVLNNVAPGTYTLQILGDTGEVTATAPVTVMEGQRAQVTL